MRNSDRPSWIRRHKALVCLLALAGILVGMVGGWGIYLNQQIANVPRVDLNLDEGLRPQRPAGDESGEKGSVNILLAGADAGDAKGPSIAESVADGSWNPGTHRSDTIIVLHISADRKKANLISVPRDTWVDIPGHGMNKINAAFSFGGPSLYVRTLEDFTGMRMDHLAIIDWDGFKELTTALGGVEVYVPKTVTDPGPDIVWTQGTHMLEGEEALNYVRQRYGLPGGDFDRIKRQQNLLRSLMKKLQSGGTLKNPFTLTPALDAVTSNLVVDDKFSTGAMRSIALSLQGLSSQDITFMTIPIKGLDRIDGQSVVLADQGQVRSLFGAVLADELDEYVETHDTDVLGGKHSVS